MRMIVAAGLSVALPWAGSARADEIFGGLHTQDVDTVFTKSGIEEGVALQLGWRGDRIGALGFIGRPSPHAFVSVSTDGGANFAAAGLSWKFGKTVYARPGIGIAIHDGPGGEIDRRDRIVFGSRVLFEPEIAVGYQVSGRVSVEASWVHLSHAQLFSRQNPGIDNIGMRVNYRF
ncbi:acyloxyacyl hydrolase [Allosphingosinicella flava]|uniref:Acyloxyacyl hydrolase n=1 Tax=Allosphingosinicella flava TaxID=2771430 RepID=A0A7T2LN25_9SPHN|nr:acyloxyacyl hydrolase [Sphingosinicella flava]QPQ56141.1 acyloxyacyl hydrolase [Sphingosinicella flava]